MNPKPILIIYIPLKVQKSGQLPHFNKVIQPIKQDYHVLLIIKDCQFPEFELKSVKDIEKIELKRLQEIVYKSIEKPVGINMNKVK
jgi:hypothetical protein